MAPQFNVREMIVPLRGQEDPVSSFSRKSSLRKPDTEDLSSWTRSPLDAAFKLQDAAAKIEDLELKHFKLTLERKEVKRELVTLRKQHKEAVLLDAQKRCRIFATRFTNTLPLELRDMVYTELWSGQSHHHDYPELGKGMIDEPKDHFDPRKSVKRDKLWSLKCEGDSCRCFNWWDLSLWLQPKWVGRNVAREAAKAYYRSLSRHPCGIQHPNENLDVANLGDYLRKDHFHLGIRPADHMRCLDLVVRATYYNVLENDGDYDDGYFAPFPTEEDLEQDNCREIAIESLPTLTHMLQPLLEIRQKKDFRLKILFKDGREHQKLEVFRPFVRTFVDAGAHVTLLSPVRGMDEHQNVLDYFDMGLEDWQNKWAAIAEARRLEDMERMRSRLMQDANEALGDDMDIYPAVLMLRNSMQMDPDVRSLTELVARGEANELQMREFGHLRDYLEWDLSTSYPDDYSEDNATDGEGD